MRLTKEQRATLREKFGGHCAYCGCELGERFHADHFEAVHRELAVEGGRFIATGKLHRPENDRMDNFMPSCAPCNLSKHAMPLEAWREWLAGHLRSLNAHHPIYRLVKAYGLVVETGKPVKFYFESYSENGVKNERRIEAEARSNFAQSGRSCQGTRARR